MAKTRLLLLFGGSASEYDDSLRSAVSVLRTLADEKYDIIPVGINKKGRWLYYPGDIAGIADGTWASNPDCTSAVLSPDPAHKGVLVLEDGSYTLKRIDVIFSLLRGALGEDGAVQGICELSRIPYVGNGITESALCRSKVMTHALLDTAGIPVPHWASVTVRDLDRLDRECDRIESKLEYPMYIKPSGSDSNLASGVAEDRASLISHIKRAFTQDDTVLIEEAAQGRELRVAVFGYDRPFASFVGELTGGSDQALKIPADIDDHTMQFIRETAIRAFHVLECRALALMDIYISPRGDILLGEVNTMPVLTEDAAYPQLMADLGMRYQYLLDKLIEQAAEHADSAV